MAHLPMISGWWVVLAGYLGAGVIGLLCGLSEMPRPSISTFGLTVLLTIGVIVIFVIATAFGLRLRGIQ